MEPNQYNAYALNNITANKGMDGSVAIQFGGCELLVMFTRAETPLEYRTWFSSGAERETMRRGDTIRRARFDRMVRHSS